MPRSEFVYEYLQGQAIKYFTGISQSLHLSPNINLQHGQPSLPIFIF